LYVGKVYHGGIIFYIDSTKKHGLIAAKTDFERRLFWTNSQKLVTGATGLAVGTGASNTQKIINVQGQSFAPYAASYCYNFEKGDYVDWYLPSKDELNLLYQQKAVVGISSGSYWSSSEATKGNAWAQDFSAGIQAKQNKTWGLSVRAISSF